MRGSLNELAFVNEGLDLWLLEKVVGRHQAVIKSIQGVYAQGMSAQSGKVAHARGMADTFEKSEGRRPRILIAKILPNTLPPMMVQLSLNMGWAILNAAGLSFIGLGVRPPTAEWGIMVAEGANYIVSGEWWLALFPGAALMLAVFTFNLLGDGLRDLVDPQRRT